MLQSTTKARRVMLFLLLAGFLLPAHPATAMDTALAARFLKARLRSRQVLKPEIRQDLRRSHSDGHFDRFRTGKACELQFTRVPPSSGSNIAASLETPEGSVTISAKELHDLSIFASYISWLKRSIFEGIIRKNSSSHPTFERKMMMVDLLRYITFSYSMGKTPSKRVLESEWGESAIEALEGRFSLRRQFDNDAPEQQAFLSLADRWSSGEITSKGFVEEALRQEAFVSAFDRPEYLIRFADYVKQATDYEPAARYVRAVLAARGAPNVQGTRFNLLVASDAIFGRNEDRE